MYEGDTPNAERRAAALALDRDLLRELLGQEELRELIDPGALEQVEADLQRTVRAHARRLASTRCTTCCAASATSRSTRRALRAAGADAAAWLEQLGGERRAVRAARRRRAALGRGRGRRACTATRSAPCRRAGCPRRSSPTCPTRWSGSCAATRARTARSRRARCATATGSTSRRCWPALERAGELVRGELRPGGTRREWCDPEVLRRLRRASLAALRKEIEPADQRALARFLPSWQGVDRHPPSGAGHRPAARGARAAAGPRAAAPRCGSATCCRAASAPTRRPGWTSCAPPARSSGSARARSGAAPARVALYFREDAAAARAAAGRAPRERPPSRAHDAIRARLAPGACFFTDLLADVAGRPDRGAAGGAVGPRVGGRGRPTTRSRRCARRSSRARRGRQQARADRARAAFSARRARRAAAGPGPLVADRARCSPPAPPTRPRAAARRPSCCSSATASSPASRCSPRASPAASRSLYDSFAALETIGVARRGYFIEGLGGAQFALPGAVERLRAQRDDDAAPPLVLAATDPAQPYGARAASGRSAKAARPPAPGRRLRRARRRRAGALRRARRQGPAGPRRRATTRASAPRSRRSPSAVQRGRIRRLAIERVNGEPVVGSAWEEPLLELGFRAGPRKLTLTA